MPALNKAREKAKAISCTSNLKQIGTAIVAYTMDNSDYIPTAWVCPYPPYGDWNIYNVPGSWVAQFYPYVNSNKIFACSSNTRTSDLGVWTQKGFVVELKASKGQPSLGYGYNLEYANYLPGFGGLASRKISRTKNISDTMILLESGPLNSGGTVECEVNAYESDQRHAFDFRHNNSMNVLYLGGNVGQSQANTTIQGGYAGGYGIIYNVMAKFNKFWHGYND